MKTPIKMLLIGMVSGLLSFLTFVMADQIDIRLPSVFGFLLLYSPGIIFAVSMALVFLKKGICTNKAFLIPWISFVTMAYAIAYHVIYVLDHDTTFFISGILGALIISIVFHFFVQKITFKEALVITLSGGLLGLCWHIGDLSFADRVDAVIRRIFTGNDSEYGNLFAMSSSLFLFIFWQGGIAYLLGRAISKKAT